MKAKEAVIEIFPCKNVFKAKISKIKGKLKL